MPTNTDESPRSARGSADAPVAVDSNPSVPSGVLLGAMPVYFLMNWAALRAAGVGFWGAFDLFTFVIPPLILIPLLIVQRTTQPFRWWAVLTVAAFLVTMAALNRLIYLAAISSV
jgi:hypothetical protein